MAKSTNNIITHGLSGKVGNLLVFSQRNGKTIVSKAPKKPTKETEKQKEQRIKFQEAIIYSKSVQEDLKNQYQEEGKSKGLTAHNIAVADFLKAPKIETIDLSNYAGKKNDLIKIKVFDDFKVERVILKIENADGSLVEEGNATEEGLYWVYKSKENNADLSGDKITVRAYDIPANMTEKEEKL
ncbi:MAG: hypothetical protein Q4G16_03400 [Cruoricaptor ignavus]|nr:hypothetical protein [Cruoricaptor ignavus]